MPAKIKGKAKGKAKGKGKRSSRKKVGGSLYTGSENSLVFSAIASFLTMIFYRLSISPDKDGIVDYKMIQSSRQNVIYIHGAILLFIGVCISFKFFENLQKPVIIITTLLSLTCFIMWFKYGLDVPINPECSIDADGKVKDKDGTKRDLNASTFMFIDDVSFVTQGIILAIFGVVIYILYKLFIHNKKEINTRVGNVTSLEKRRVAKETADAKTAEAKETADAAEKETADTKSQREHELEIAKHEGEVSKERMLHADLIKRKNSENSEKKATEELRNVRKNLHPVEDDL